MKFEFKKYLLPMMSLILAGLGLGLLFFSAQWLRPSANTSLYELTASAPGFTINQIRDIDEKLWKKRQMGDLITATASDSKWAKVKVQNRFSTNREITVSILWPHLSQIRHYAFVDQKLARSGTTGTEAENPEPKRNSPFFHFTYDIPPGTSLEAYYNTESLLLQKNMFHIGTPKEAIRATRLITLALGFIIGGLICLSLYNLFIGATLGQGAYVLTALFFAGQALMDAAFWYFPGFTISQGEGWSAGITVLLALLLVPISSLLLTRKILLGHISKKWSTAIFSLVGLGHFLAVTILFTPLQLGFTLATIYGLIGGTTSYLIAIRLKKQHPEAKYLILCYSVIYLFLSIQMFENAGMIPAKMINTTLLGIAQLLASIVLSFVLASRVKSMEEEKQVIHDALVGNVPKTVLNTVLKSPDSLDLNATERDVTIMFIDIVGFSTSSQKMPPATTFSHLKSCLGGITKIIKECGGTVDRSLGDGVLCFFGYSVDGYISKNHAELALTAARRIQAFSLDFILKQTSDKEAPFPLRIGIHTTKVFLGNLGDRNRIDYTMIGNGVNFAARLEAACNPFRIMISESTKNKIDGPQLGDGVIHPIKISVKHQTAEVLAFEYSEAFRHDKAIVAAEKKYWQFLGKLKLQTRVPLSFDGKIWIQSHLGIYKIKDVSRSGFGVTGNQFLGRNVTFQGRISSSDPKINELLVDRSLHIVTLSVRWGRFGNGVYKHGLHLLGLNAIQRNYLFDEILNSFGLDPEDYGDDQNPGEIPDETMLATGNH